MLSNLIYGISFRKLRTYPTFKEEVHLCHQVMDMRSFWVHSIECSNSYINFRLRTISKSLNPQQLYFTHIIKSGQKFIMQRYTITDHIEIVQIYNENNRNITYDNN